MTVLQATGSPTPDELAAALAVLTSAGTSVEEPEQVPASLWNDRSALLRRPVHPGPGAWRAAR